ncbi:hexosaminidase D-like [Dermacentor albipictus]|uniref:hexosaminidase D-like n=1 Tax=Dermacentor albipictus TaxID=60249 RepID=UPI0038FC87B0
MARAALLAVLLPQVVLAAINVIPPHRLVHLDLKGAPPKASYLITLIPILKSLGATGLLIEYEDSFPFVGEPLHALASPRAYTRQELRAVLDTARDYDLTVVPLINTFDKLEYILKHPQFAKYRESPSVPDTLCPSNPAGVKLIQDILDQILNFHHTRELYYVHIGCGDVAALGLCGRCTARSFEPARRGNSRSGGRFGLYDKYMLYMSYVQLITNYLKEHHGVKTIVWHDTLAKIPNELYQLLPIHLHVEVMVATYRTDLELSGWLNFASRFGDSLWVATSFKDVGEAPVVYPRLKERVKSHVTWTRAMSQWKDHVRFPGVALMGPQRTSHDSPLRELLPTSLPSLAVCLAVVRKSGQLPTVNIGSSPIEQILKCNHTIDLNVDYKMQGVNCKFPGAAIVDELHTLETLKHHLDLLPYLPLCKPSYEKSRDESKECVKNLNSQIVELSSVNLTLRTALQEVYSKDIADEYVTDKIATVMADIKRKQELLDASGSLRNLRSTAGTRYRKTKWPSRSHDDADDRRRPHVQR